MKIRKISFVNHPIYRNLDLDFTDKEGKTINTIIIAGENGVGKSLLLNTIYEFSNLGLSHEKRDEKRIFEIELTDSEIDILKANDGVKHAFQSTEKFNILKITIDYNIIGNWNQVDIKGISKGSYMPTLGGTAFVYNDTKGILKMIFSDIAINFTPKEIKTVTSTNLDRINPNSEKSNANLATEITQLLIDIQSIDALELNEWVRRNSGQPVPENIVDLRTKRFTKAFDFMFSSKKYKRIDSINNQKQVIFEESGREMTIAQLSSGEKQIVFRGSFLLKDLGSSKGALILIDEPEISLHPSWQLKILSFFKKLFTDDSGEQSSQIIVTTHSPFIIHNSNRNFDKVIVLQKKTDGSIEVLTEPNYFGWSPEKIVEEAFKISHFISSSRITVFVEGETDEKYFNKCLQVFGRTEPTVHFTWIGRINDKGQAENSGDTALNQAKTFLTANMEQVKSKTVLLYDNDTNKPEETVGNIMIKCMSSNEVNQVYKIGVENLLDLIPEIDPSKFYKERRKTDKYGAESILRELDKVKLCDFICDELKVDDQKKVLANVNKEIERIMAIA